MRDNHRMDDPTWIVRLDAPGDGPRLAVKDCIDVEGLPTTVGCQLIAEQASRRNMTEAAAITGDQRDAASRTRGQVQDWFAAMLDRHPFLALPTLVGPPPLLGEQRIPLTMLTMPANLAGLPALALPVPSPAGLPASLQLIGPHGSEEQLIALGGVIEAALR
jgi:Asp-tRNA(Asn)/Glu-tRNA(Gln) amidotransferase A subunit family amidase